MKPHSATKVLTLIKFLDGVHTKKVLNGNLKMGSVKRFREAHEKDTGLRNDNNEFLSYTFSAGPDFEIIIEHNTCPVGRIFKMSDRLDLDNRCYLFSMSAITLSLFDDSDRWCFDSRVSQLGDKAIIVTEPDEFERRIRAVLKHHPFLIAYPETDRQTSGLIEYINLDYHNGFVGPFRKSKEYEFQREWRFALIDSRDNAYYPDSIFLDIGDLTDIAFVVDTQNLINKFFSIQRWP
jgi:hypothetical protein